MLIHREMTLMGTYFPTLLILMLLAAVLTGLIDRWLVKQDYYRFIWHSALFRFSLFIIFSCCLGLMVYR